MILCVTNNWTPHSTVAVPARSHGTKTPERLILSFRASCREVALPSIGLPIAIPGVQFPETPFVQDPVLLIDAKMASSSPMQLNCRPLKDWQKGGLYTAGASGFLGIFLELLNRTGWWYQETIWFQALVNLNYPAGELKRIVLNKLEVPRLYDVPLTWREAVIINLTDWTFAIIRWFLLGAAVSTVWKRLRRSS